MKRREKSFTKKDKIMKNFKNFITLLTLGTLTAPCLMGMDPSEFPFANAEITPPKTRKTRKVVFFERGNSDYPLAPKTTLPLESCNASPREGALSTQESILEALPTGEPFDEKAVAPKTELYQKRLEAVLNEALDTGDTTLLHNEKGYFLSARVLAAAPDEKQVLSACIEKLQTLISMHEKHQNCLTFVLREALETNQTAGLRLSLENRFIPALTAATDPDEKAVLLDCIAQLNAAINKLQFPKQATRLESKKHYPPAQPANQENPFKPHVNKAGEIFKEMRQQEIDNAMLIAKETDSTKPLQDLITNFAELMLSADTTPFEQSVLSDHINTLQDAISAQKINLHQRATKAAQSLLTANNSTDTLHVYNRRKTSSVTKLPQQHLLREKGPETTPHTIISSSCPVQPQPKDTAQEKTATLMTETQFQTILDAIHMEYKQIGSIKLLEDTLKIFVAHNAAESPAAKTLLFLKNNPQFLLTDMQAKS
ncbi:hypothetical protein [Methylicorpusculum sp.]|uniref:hypothetical protein n=1 Tax=Methylicorpusculum sp. TaxID=2713644 RepID=UPI002AB82314|nr:hypothetical protein [Methylicorpusculum sp.]MDZ4151780.1 hypothetical protein [Methylicorpusculum sp.]